MRSLDFRRYVLSGCATAAMLAGCGGSRPPIGAPGAMPQTAAAATPPASKTFDHTRFTAKAKAISIR